MAKNALIVANLAGFASFLIHDIEILIGKGYTVTFAANAYKLEWADTKEKLDRLGVKFIQLNFDSTNPMAKTNFKAYKELKELLKQESFQLIHCHTPIAGIFTRLAARSYRRKGTKVIYTTHGFAFTENSSKKSWIVFYTVEKFCSLFCDAIITINKEDYSNAKRMFCKKVFYINGVGVDTSKYANVVVNCREYRKLIGVPADKIMILAVGELSTRKNHQIIIKALSKLPNKNDYVFVICGNGIDGGTGKMLHDLAKQEDVDLRMLGFRMDIPEITAISDIGVIPSIREGLGLAGVQSLAAGVPVIGSSVQGIKDYIVDGKDGYLCAPFDDTAFAEKIELLSDVRKRNEMKPFCREMAAKFDNSVSFEQMQKIYDEMA